MRSATEGASLPTSAAAPELSVTPSRQYPMPRLFLRKAAAYFAREVT
jgi:hypothetical protein